MCVHGTLRLGQYTMGVDWLTDGLVGMTRESTTQHSAILHENAQQRTGLWKLILRSTPRGVLPTMCSLGLWGMETAARGLAFSHSGAHKMSSLRVSSSLPCNFHFFPGHTALHGNAHSQQTPAVPMLGNAEAQQHFRFSLWSILSCTALSISWPVFTSTWSR